MKLAEIERCLKEYKNCSSEVRKEIKDFLSQWLFLVSPGSPIFIDFGGKVSFIREEITGIRLKMKDKGIYVDISKLDNEWYYREWHIKEMLEAIKYMVENKNAYRMEICPNTLHVKRKIGKKEGVWELIEFQIIANTAIKHVKAIDFLNRAGIEVKKNGFYDKKTKTSIIEGEGWEIKEGKEILKKIIEGYEGELKGVLTLKKIL